MTRRYLWILVAIVAVAAALSALSVPKMGRSSRASSAVAGAPTIDLAVVVEGRRLMPAAASVPKGVRVRLRVDNRGRAPARLALAGYEDALSIPAIAPGGTWQGSFLADRPGDDFAWLLDGQPVARFAVTGSHLVEGHR